MTRRARAGGWLAGLTWAMLAAATVSAASEPAATARPAPRGLVAATEVLAVANQVARSLATNERIPEGAVVALSDGRMRSLSPAQVFVLLARFTGTGYEEGMTPEYTPAPPADMLGPLEISAATVGTERAAVLVSADILAQARPTADVAEGTGKLPNAIWVSGLRLTPAQFMGALATMLQHAALHGIVPEQVAVGNYLPPLDWAAPAPLPPPARTLPAPPEVEPHAPAPAPTPPPGKPRLTVFIPSTPPLSGEQSLSIEYEGPRAFIRLSIDGKARAVSNMAHFTYVWDTRLEPDGDHVLTVVASGEADRTLAEVKATIATANGNLPLR